MSQIKECPDKPNCVSSLSQKEYAKIEPLPLIEDITTSKNKIIAVMKSMDRTQLITDSSNYLHFTCKTKLLRFTDDIEFEIDAKNKLIHIKSASRTGHSDFGVNRKRVEQIRSLLR